MQLRLESERDRIFQEPSRQPHTSLGLNEFLLSSRTGRDRFTELMELLFSLFEGSSLLEFQEETKSLDVSLDEEEESLIVKLKKRTKSKKLATIGNVYLLVEKSRESSLTLVYELRPLPEREVVQELQQREEVKPMIKPIQPRLTILDEGVPIEYPVPEELRLPLPAYTTIFEDEPQNQIAYEEKFGAMSSKDNPLEEPNRDFQEYPISERLVRPDEYKKYDLNSITETRQLLEENVKELSGVIIEKYDKPLYEDGEFIYEKIRIKTDRWTTVLDATISSGLRVSWKYVGNGDAYVVLLNDHRDGDRGLYVEYKVNGKYGTVAANKCVVPPRSEIVWLVKTSSGGCSSSNN